MTDVTAQRLLGSKTLGQRDSIGQRAASIVSNVEYQSVGITDEGKDIVEIGGADGTIERTVTNVSHRVTTIHYILHTSRVPVIRAKIILTNQVVVVVGGIILIPRPIASNIERGIDIYVAVAQGINHLVEHVEKLELCLDGVLEKRGIFAMHTLPIDTLLFKEAIMLIERLPERLEVTAQTIVLLQLVIVETSSEEPACRQQATKSCEPRAQSCEP